MNEFLLTYFTIMNQTKANSPERREGLLILVQASVGRQIKFS